MDLNVETENLEKIVQSMREMIKDHLLPRITNLEEEVRLLRKITWPICQGARETFQLNDIQAKREFLCNLDSEEVHMLLKLKSRGLLKEEYNKLNLPIKNK